jgi:hypothetical protein
MFVSKELPFSRHPEIHMTDGDFSSGALKGLATCVLARLVNAFAFCFVNASCQLVSENEGENEPSSMGMRQNRFGRSFGFLTPL